MGLAAIGASVLLATSVAAAIDTPEQPVPVAAPSPAPGPQTAPVATSPDTATLPAPPGETAASATPSPPAEDHETIVVAARRRVGIDPLEDVNEASFGLTTAVDRSLFAPVALGYARIVPEPARDGLRNFVSNLNEPVSFINFLLQLKIGKAVETAARFTINSSLGAFGVIDVARAPGICLPRRSVGLAETLGVYGVGTGPYFYIPLVGPTSVRTAAGGAVDRLILPTLIGGALFSPYYVIPSAILTSLNRRARNDDRIRAIRQSADPYVASRDSYLDRRKARVEALRATAKDEATAYCETWRTERAARKR